MVLGALATVDDFGGLRRETEEIGIHEGVIDDDVRAAEEFRAAHRQQARITRARADEINRSMFHKGAEGRGRAGARQNRNPPSPGGESGFASVRVDKTLKPR